MLMAALPVLLRVAVSAVLVVPTGWLPKARLVGERPSTGAVAVVSVPVPERLTSCGLPRPIQMLIEAVRLPLAEGVNFTLIAQLLPAATDLPHVLVSAKLLPLAPWTERLVISKPALLVLLRVTVRAVLVVRTCWLPKARLVCERLTADVLILKRLVACGLPVALSVRVTLVVFSVVPPLFVSVTAWALLVLPSTWLANIMLGGDKFAVGCSTPVPDSAMLLVRLLASLTIDRVPVTLPPTGGANSTLKVALWWAFRVRGSTSPLMLRPAPVTVACETVMLQVPRFVRVTRRARLVPTVTLPNLRLELITIPVDAAASLARLKAAKGRST